MNKENNKIKNEIILIGYQTFNCYGMLRSLANAKFTPKLILGKSKISFITKSRYAKSVEYFENPSEIPNILKKNYTNNENKPIVICCDDPIQSIIDKSYSELSQYFILSNSDGKSGEITKLMDKDIQMDIAKKADLDVPESWYIPKTASIPESIKYPCIAKPYRSISGSKSDIKICTAEKELKDIVGTKDYIVQQYIEKDFEVILWGTSIGNEKFYIPGVAKKIRHYPKEWSLSSFGVLESFEKHKGLDLNKVMTFLKLLKYRGMFSIEMAVKDGKYYFLEINLRNDGKQHFSTVAGANLPALYIHSVLGMEIKCPKVKLPTYYMGELTDFRNVIKGNLPLYSFIRDLLKTKSFFIWNSKDPFPFIYELVKKIK